MSRSCDFACRKGSGVRQVLRAGMSSLGRVVGSGWWDRTMASRYGVGGRWPCWWTTQNLSSWTEAAGEGSRQISVSGCGHLYRYSTGSRGCVRIRRRWQDDRAGDTCWALLLDDGSRVLHKLPNYLALSNSREGGAVKMVPGLGPCLSLWFVVFYYLLGYYLPPLVLWHRSLWISCFFFSLPSFFIFLLMFFYFINGGYAVFYMPVHRRHIPIINSFCLFMSIYFMYNYWNSLVSPNNGAIHYKFVKFDIV